MTKDLPRRPGVKHSMQVNVVIGGCVVVDVSEGMAANTYGPYKTTDHTNHISSKLSEYSKLPTSIKKCTKNNKRRVCTTSHAKQNANEPVVIGSKHHTTSRTTETNEHDNIATRNLYVHKRTV